MNAYQPQNHHELRFWFLSFLPFCPWSDDAIILYLNSFSIKTKVIFHPLKLSEPSEDINSCLLMKTLSRDYYFLIKYCLHPLPFYKVHFFLSSTELSWCVLFPVLCKKLLVSLKNTLGCNVPADPEAGQQSLNVTVLCCLLCLSLQFCSLRCEMRLH